MHILMPFQNDFLNIYIFMIDLSFFYMLYFNILSIFDIVLGENANLQSLNNSYNFDFIN